MFILIIELIMERKNVYYLNHNLMTSNVNYLIRVLLEKWNKLKYEKDTISIRNWLYDQYSNIIKSRSQIQELFKDIITQSPDSISSKILGCRKHGSDNKLLYYCRWYNALNTISSENNTLTLNEANIYDILDRLCYLIKDVYSKIEIEEKSEYDSYVINVLTDKMNFYDNLKNQLRIKTSKYSKIEKNPNKENIVADKNISYANAAKASNINISYNQDINENKDVNVYSNTIIVEDFSDQSLIDKNKNFKIQYQKKKWKILIILHLVSNYVRKMKKIIICITKIEKSEIYRN